MQEDSSLRLLREKLTHIRKLLTELRKHAVSSFPDDAVHDAYMEACIMVDEIVRLAGRCSDFRIPNFVKNLPEAVEAANPKTLEMDFDVAWGNLASRAAVARSEITLSIDEIDKEIASKETKSTGAGDSKEDTRTDAKKKQASAKRKEAGKRRSSFWREDKNITRHDHFLIKKRFNMNIKRGMSKNAAAEDVAYLLNEDARIGNDKYKERSIQTWDAYPITGKDAVLSFMRLKEKKTGEKARKEDSK